MTTYFFRFASRAARSTSFTFSRSAAPVNGLGRTFKSFQRHLILKTIIDNRATSCPFAFLQTACSGLEIKNLRGMSHFSDDRSKVSRRLGLIDSALACTTPAELNQELQTVIPVPAVAFFQPSIQPLVLHSHF